MLIKHLNTSIIDIFNQIKSGNKAEFDKLFRQYYQDLCRFAVYLSCSPTDAEEIVQDIFFKIWINRKKLTVHSSIKTYLFTSVRNSVYNLHKHEKVKNKYIEYEKAENINVESNDSLFHEEVINKINQTIDKLPDKRKQVFKLSKIEGLKYKEIAERLNISVKTVENHMGEALKFLRKNLNKSELIIIIIMIYILANYNFEIGVFSNFVVN